MDGMSIWGRRVDNWFDRKTGTADMNAGERDAAAFRTIGIVALLVVVVVVLAIATS